MLSPPPSTLDHDGFVDAYGGVYEHSDWIAEAAYADGLTKQDDTAEGLAGRMAAIVDAAPNDRKLDLLNAHPELAGKLAIAGDLTESSRSEQASVGLDQCTPEEFSEFQDLNARYRKRFGFPFIIAVRGLDRVAILAALRMRVENGPNDEFITALGQVHKIARLRLAAMDQG